MKRAPLKRSPLRRKQSSKPRRQSAKTLRNKCDALWSRIIRMGGKCEICGCIGAMNAHHLISRRAVFFRHNLENGVCLCPSCHEFDIECSAHGAPWAFDAAFKRLHPDRWEWWEKNRRAVITGTKIDYAAVYAELKRQLAKREKENA